MKTAKIEVTGFEAAMLHRGLDAYEREVLTDKEASPAEKATTLSSVESLRVKVATAFARVRVPR